MDEKCVSIGYCKRPRPKIRYNLTCFLLPSELRVPHNSDQLQEFAVLKLLCLYQSHFVAGAVTRIMNTLNFFTTNKCKNDGNTLIIRISSINVFSSNSDSCLVNLFIMSLCMVSNKSPPKTSNINGQCCLGFNKRTCDKDLYSIKIIAIIPQ